MLFVRADSETLRVWVGYGFQRHIIFETVSVSGVRWKSEQRMSESKRPPLTRGSWDNWISFSYFLNANIVSGLFKNEITFRNTRVHRQHAGLNLYDTWCSILEITRLEFPSRLYFQSHYATWQIGYAIKHIKSKHARHLSNFIPEKCPSFLQLLVTSPR